MSEEKIYELRTDIWTPAKYCKAGDKRTEKEWQKEFGHFNIEWASEWFIDLSELNNDEDKADELSVLVDKIFERKRLHSLTYKEAAREVAESWLKQNQSK